MDPLPLPVPPPPPVHSRVQIPSNPTRLLEGPETTLLERHPSRSHGTRSHSFSPFGPPPSSPRGGLLDSLGV